MIGSLGQEGSNWFHWLIWLSGFQSRLSWSTVMVSAKSVCLLTTMERPSVATGISMNSMPASSQAGTSSSWSIGREASEIWVSPEQNASNPSSVPAPPTVIYTFGFSCVNSSATAWVIGSTVLEPSMAI